MRRPAGASSRTSRATRRAGLALALVLLAAPPPALAQQGPPPGAGAAAPGAQPAKGDEDVRPYDERLSRLSELLGAIHFLRELCGANEGQQWRDRMKELLDAEGTSALRRARLTRSFNTGWRLFSRTYSSCTPSAQATAAKFLGEAAQVAETLSKQP